MTRVLFASLFALAIASPSFAQDMPLSQILIDGEGWKKVNAPGAKPADAMGLHMTLTPDRATAFLSSPGQRFLSAAPVTEDGVSAQQTRPYAPLRTKRGANGIDVGGLATDTDGRIYALTDIGVQVFDPTGRLCGVLTPAAEGKPEFLAFEGDVLTHWIEDTKYARKLNTTGTK